MRYHRGFWMVAGFEPPPCGWKSEPQVWIRPVSWSLRRKVGCYHCIPIKREKIMLCTPRWTSKQKKQNKTKTCPYLDSPFVAIKVWFCPITCVLHKHFNSLEGPGPSGPSKEGSTCDDRWGTSWISCRLWWMIGATLSLCARCITGEGRGSPMKQFDFPNHSSWSRCLMLKWIYTYYIYIYIIFIRMETHIGICF